MPLKMKLAQRIINVPVGLVAGVNAIFVPIEGMIKRIQVCPSLRHHSISAQFISDPDPSSVVAYRLSIYHPTEFEHPYIRVCNEARFDLTFDPLVFPTNDPVATIYIDYLTAITEEMEA